MNSKTETISVGQKVIITTGDMKGEKGIIYDAHTPKYMEKPEPRYVIHFPNHDLKWWYWRNEFDLIEPAP